MNGRYCVTCRTRIYRDDRYLVIEETSRTRRFFCSLVCIALWIADGESGDSSAT